MWYFGIFEAHILQTRNLFFTSILATEQAVSSWVDDITSALHCMLQDVEEQFGQVSMSSM